MAESKLEFKYGTPQIHFPTCDKHGELIDMVCEDCDEFVCTDCAKSDHKDHDWVTVLKAASQRRRQLHEFIKSIKEEKVSEIDRKIEEASTKMKEMEKESDNEVEKIRKHFDEIIARLTKIKTRHEKTLRDNLTERSEQANGLKNQAEEQRKNLMKKMKLMEENNSTMSDHTFIENHRELSKLVSAEDVDTKTCEYSLRYTSRNICDDELDLLMGQTYDLDDISATETNSFQYSDEPIGILNAFSEKESYVQFNESEYIVHINKQGDKKHKYDVTMNDFCVTDAGEVYFTDYQNKTIARLSPSGSGSPVVNTHPLIPGGICMSLDGGFLVMLENTESEAYNESDADNESEVVNESEVFNESEVVNESEADNGSEADSSETDSSEADNESEADIESEADNESKSKPFILASRSKYLLRHLSSTGDDSREYEYQEDGQTRLFTVPFRVQQNGNSDICVVNLTSFTTGNLVILSLSGRLRSVYHGQNLSENFRPSDVACDSRCNILVTDYHNNRVHLLSSDGEFLKFLLTENEVFGPFALSLCGSTLWVGNAKGTVKVYQL